MRRWLLRWFPFTTRAGRAFGERFTPLGKWLLATCAIAGIFSADPTRTHAYLLFAGSGALLLVSFTWSLLWRPRVMAQRVLPEHATLGRPADYGVVLVNHGRRVLREVRVADRLRLRYPTRAEFDAELADAPEDNWFDRRVGFLRWQRLRQRLQGATLATVVVDELRPGCAGQAALSVTPLRRGWLQFDAVRLLQADPLGLCHAVRTLQLSDRLLSRPALVPMANFSVPAPRAQRRDQGQSRRRGDGLEFFALRDYRPGDPWKHIDWRASARRGQPIVRQFAIDARQTPRLVVDTAAAQRLHGDFEAMVTVAASLLVAAHDEQRGLALTLLTANGPDQRLALVGDALDALAELMPSGEDTAAAWQRLDDELEPGLPLLVVCARWDDQRAAALAGFERHCDVLVLCTDPLAATADGVVLIEDPARDLPSLAWPARLAARVS